MSEMVSPPGRFMSQERVRLWAPVPSIGIGIWVLYVWLVRGQELFGDFGARWSAGRILRSGKAEMLYDPATQIAVQGAESSFSWFVSPPNAALLFLPFGWPQEERAALAWAVINIVLLGIAGWLMGLWLEMDSNSRRTAVVVLLATYPTFALVVSGQDTSVVLVAVLGGALLARRGFPMAGGALWALTLLKPHLALLLPLLLIFTGRWRMLFGATLASVCWGLCSVLVLGVEAWEDWLAAVTSEGYRSEVHSAQAVKSANVLALIRHWVPDAALLLGVTQVLLVIVAVGSVFWASRRSTDLSTPLAVTLLATPLAAPHYMVYDAVLLVPAVALLILRGIPRTRSLAFWSFGLFWLTPFFAALSVKHPEWAWLVAPWWTLPATALWWCAAASSRNVPDRSDQASTAT